MRLTLTVATTVAMLTLTGCASVGGDVTVPPSPTRSFLHPAGDVQLNEATCDSENQLYVTVRITNHSSHDMAYDIVWDETDKSGKVTGAAEGVYELIAGQVLPDERLFGGSGTCGPRNHLGSIRAYDSTNERGQPYFG